MKKACYLCRKQITERDEYRFFPEDDSYICKACLTKSSKKEERNKENISM